MNQKKEEPLSLRIEDLGFVLACFLWKKKEKKHITDQKSEDGN